jgi:hypothetical protein
MRSGGETAEEKPAAIDGRAPAIIVTSVFGYNPTFPWPEGEMTRLSATAVAVLSALVPLLGAQACRPAGSGGADDIVLGAEAPLGEGSVASFARFDREGTPEAIGLLFSAATLKSLPTERTDQHHCFDLDGDGAIAPDSECVPTHERVIPLPSEASRRADIPFKWVLLNWNPVGHIPPGIYDVPHFDIHFYIESIENTFAIADGPCGPEHVRCDQFERAMRPVPSNYTHPDFQNVQAAAPAMGNHLIDTSAHEFQDTAFDRSWIFGTYDGHITFYEEMVALDYLAGRRDACHDIKLPEAFEAAGYYPTRSCYKFDPEAGTQAVSMEGFVYREASPPAPMSE